MQIKKEFKDLIPPLSQEEFKQLEENCLKEGIRDAIVTWQGFIIDGHNRYEIAQRHGLEYQTIKKAFESENDVIEWMIVNQLGRRNITKEQKDYLIGKRYENEKAKDSFKGNQYTVGIDQNDPKQTTAEKIAKEVGIGEAQVKRNEQFAKGVDKLSQELKQQVLQGKLDVTKLDVQAISKAEPAFIAKTENDIIAKAKEIKERKAEEYKEKLNQRIDQKTQQIEISLDQQLMIEDLKQGKTVVINMNEHFHVLKYAKENNIYKQIDRYSEWGNPFYLDSDGNRDEVCDAFEIFYKHKRSLHSKISELKGKALGCHCHPNRCHGHFLKNITDGNN